MNSTSRIGSKPEPRPRESKFVGDSKYLLHHIRKPRIGLRRRRYIATSGYVVSADLQHDLRMLNIALFLNDEALRLFKTIGERSNVLNIDHLVCFRVRYEYSVEGGLWLCCGW